MSLVVSYRIEVEVDVDVNVALFPRTVVGRTVGMYVGTRSGMGSSSYNN